MNRFIKAPLRWLPVTIPVFAPGFEGASFIEVIERRLLGRRSRLMLRPDQEVVRWYGQEIRADDPRVYRWD